MNILINEIIMNTYANVKKELSGYISSRLADLREELAVTSVTKKERVVGISAEILELYRVAEQSKLILCERSKIYES